jgi:DNA-binding beta-propeller fold protein YncE
VFDIVAGTFTRVEGFKTAEREHHGKTRKMGPSAASVGDGVVYIGNRATSEVCPIDEKTLKLGKCLKLPTPTDGVVYVASAKEVWVTTPRDQSLTVLDASKPGALKQKLVIKTPGEPEGYAVDESRGQFYTNLEDKNRTLIVDIKTHAVKSNWAAGCGNDGPRGIALDTTRQFVFVACTSNVQILDGSHEGSLLGKVETGAGVDNIDYLESTHMLYVAAAKAAKLTVARIDDKGQPSIVATATTVQGARNAVVDSSGNIYLAESMGARFMLFAAPR